MERGTNSKKINDFCVLICAFNEAEHIEHVVKTALEQHPGKVVVVDDGSTDNTAGLAEKAGATVLRNSTNLGKGSSLKRGIEYLQSHPCDAVAERRVEDDRLGVGVVEEVPQLVVEVAVVDVDGHAAHLEHAELRLHELVRVVHEERDLGARPETGCAQRTRHTRRTIVVLRP